MKKINVFFVILLAFGLVFAGCGALIDLISGGINSGGNNSPGGGAVSENSDSGGYNSGGNNPGYTDNVFTFTGVFADGSAAQTTGSLILAFNAEIYNLTADDITLSGVPGVIKGFIGNYGNGRYDLPISGFSSGGDLRVAVSKQGYVINGSPQTVTIYYSALRAPTGVKAEGQSQDSIDISWDEVPGAAGYNVYYKKDYASPINFICAVSENSYTHAGLEPDTSYYYCVTAAADTGEETAYSSFAYAATWPVPTMPSVPSGVSATDVSLTEIRITWGSVQGATSYRIYRHYNTYPDESFSLIHETEAAVNSYIDTPPNLIYSWYYKVSAVNSVGESAQSEYKRAKLDTIIGAWYRTQAEADWTKPTLTILDKPSPVYVFGENDVLASGAEGHEVHYTLSGNTVTFTTVTATGDEVIFATAIFRVQGSSLIISNISGWTSGTYYRKSN